MSSSSYPSPGQQPFTPPSSQGPGFVIPLFDIGEVDACVFSWCCFPCAMAQSRTYMDGSSCLFNFFCLSPVANRWLVRSSYGINGDPCNDCYTATFCPCCTANQLYQTTKRYGSSTSDGGALFNTGGWTHSYGTGSFRDCLYSFFCMPCAIGHMMEQTMEMPWAMGCCCVNLCVARNLIRYQHRIRGNDLIEECAFPYGLKCIGDISQSFFPLIWCVLWGVFVAASMQQLQEVQSRSTSSSSTSPEDTSGPSGGRYLFRNTSDAATPAEGAHVIPVYPSSGMVAYPSGTSPSHGAGGVELIQPVAVSISSPFHRTPSGYSRVTSVTSGNPHTNGGVFPPNVSYSIGQPLSEKEV